MSGWIDFRCTICGELRRQPLEPLGHEVVNGICVRCGEVMQLPFRDVPEDAYYYDAVVWGLSRGVVIGTYDDVLTGPVLHPRAGSHVPVACCRETGALRQYGLCRCPGGQLLCRGRCLGGGEQRYERHMRGCFSPDDLCTRAQIVTLLYRQLTKEIWKNRIHFLVRFLRQHRTIQREHSAKNIRRRPNYAVLPNKKRRKPKR